MVNIIDIVIWYISKFNICVTNTQKVKFIFYIIIIINATPNSDNMQ